VLKLNTLSGFGSGVSGAGATGQGTYGYVQGGQATGVNTPIGDRVTFATSVLAAHTDADLSYNPEQPGFSSDANSFGYGYVCGGYTAGNQTTGNRTTFSTSITAAHTDANLSVGQGNLEGTSDATAYGYIAGDGASNIGQRITFSTSVTAAHTDANLSSARYDPACTSDGNTVGYGYFCGGFPHPSPRTTTTDRITFSTSVTAAHTDADLTTGASDSAGNSDMVAYGYVCAGTTGAVADTGRRMTFATSVLALHTDADLTDTAANFAMMGDGAIYGYAFKVSSGRTNIGARQTFATSVWALHTDVDMSIARNGQVALSDASAQ